MFTLPPSPFSCWLLKSIKPILRVNLEVVSLSPYYCQAARSIQKSKNLSKKFSHERGPTRANFVSRNSPQQTWPCLFIRAGTQKPNSMSNRASNSESFYFFRHLGHGEKFLNKTRVLTGKNPITNHILVFRNFITLDKRPGKGPHEMMTWSFNT